MQSTLQKRQALCGGEQNLTNLCQIYGTPLLVYDVAKIKDNAVSVMRGLLKSDLPAEVTYSLKAFCCGQLLRLCANTNMSVDVVSGGELYATCKYGVDPKKIFFHGNNKSEEELTLAIAKGVKIIVDNFEELQLLGNLAKKPVDVLLRLNTGVQAHTHKYIATANVDDKFGISLEGDDLKNCIDLIDNTPNINLIGIAGHIGSQILEVTAYCLHIDRLVAVAKNLNRPLSLNIGGGFGIKYTDQDGDVDLEAMVSAIALHLKSAVSASGAQITEVIAECGRSIVGDAGVTLYTAGQCKSTPHRRYVFVDGGMSDNIRPALYEAKYDFKNLTDNSTDMQKFTIAGKLCESGDVLGEAYLPSTTKSGDIIICYCTGAYCYAMSSNYNFSTKPAVVFWEGDTARLVLRRQTLADLFALEHL